MIEWFFFTLCDSYNVYWLIFLWSIWQFDSYTVHRQTFLSLYDNLTEYRQTGIICHPILRTGYSVIIGQPHGEELHTNHSKSKMWFWQFYVGREDSWVRLLRVRGDRKMGWSGIELYYTPGGTAQRKLCSDILHNIVTKCSWYPEFYLRF